MNGNGTTPPAERELSRKIARLVQERGWNQEDFARISGLNRHTVRTILHSHERESRRLRNHTVNLCARALGLSVHDLRTLPLDRLLPRMHGQPADPGDDVLRHLLDSARQPELLGWLERNADRARRFSVAEADELLALEGPAGPLARFGPEHFADLIERRRELLRRVRAVAASEYLDFLERFVGLLYEKVRPADPT
jgi:transcriptional regulator with XRE-family HTH domain